VNCILISFFKPEYVDYNNKNKKVKVI